MTIPPIYPLTFTTIAGAGEVLAGAGVGTTHGSGTADGDGMPVGAGEALAGAGVGTILGDGTAGAGVASVGAGMPVGVGPDMEAGAGTAGAGEATVGAGTTAITIEMLPLIAHVEDIQTIDWPVMLLGEDQTLGVLLEAPPQD